MTPLTIAPFFASGAVSVDLDLTFVAHFILFTAFVVLTKDLIFEPLLKVFEERDRRTRGAIDRARQMDEHAIALKQELDAALEAVRREAAVDRESARARVKKVEAELMASTREAAAKTLSAGMAALGAEVQEIRKDLDAERHKLGAEIASRVLGREVRP